ncbi:MAG: hypothetical protein LBC88_01875 [Spirochaetaceae bacterium]|nr:hypothetical protein [Spirochaetaceae bacterium]
MPELIYKKTVVIFPEPGARVKVSRDIFKLYISKARAGKTHRIILDKIACVNIEQCVKNIGGNMRFYLRRKTVRPGLREQGALCFQRKEKENQYGPNRYFAWGGGDL